MRLLAACALLLSGCSVMKADSELAEKVNGHSRVIMMMTDYISALQLRGMLPYPTDIESKENKK